MTRPRVLLAEDFDLVARQLRDLLEPECDVVGVVRSGTDLVCRAKKDKPNGIISDITMPGVDGLSAAEQILESGLPCWVVFVSVHLELEMVRRALKIGALGYVSKLSAGEDLIPAVRAAQKGERFLSPILAIKPQDLLATNHGSE